MPDHPFCLRTSLSEAYPDLTVPMSAARSLFLQHRDHSSEYWPPTYCMQLRSVSIAKEHNCCSCVPPDAPAGMLRKHGIRSSIRRSDNCYLGSVAATPLEMIPVLSAVPMLGSTPRAAIPIIRVGRASSGVLALAASSAVSVQLSSKASAIGASTDLTAITTAALAASGDTMGSTRRRS